MLVQPLYGGNVGSTARAMSNFGLRELFLVRPQYTGQLEARKMAMGGKAVLEAAETFATVEDAVSGCTQVIACTARPRRWKAWKAMGPDAAGQLLAERGAEGEGTALLFGAEDSGLDNKALALATHLCHIPTSREVSSLNLSQAVLLLAWEWGKAHGALYQRPHRNRKRGTPPSEQIHGTVEQVAGLLDRIAFFKGRNRDQALATVQQILVRGEMTDTEVHFLRGVLRKLKWHVDHGDRLP